MLEEKLKQGGQTKRGAISNVELVSFFWGNVREKLRWSYLLLLHTVRIYGRRLYVILLHDHRIQIISLNLKSIILIDTTLCTLTSAWGVNRSAKTLPPCSHINAKNTTTTNFTYGTFDQVMTRLVAPNYPVLRCKSSKCGLHVRFAPWTEQFLITVCSRQT